MTAYTHTQVPQNAVAEDFISSISRASGVIVLVAGFIGVAAAILL